MRRRVQTIEGYNVDISLSRMPCCLVLPLALAALLVKSGENQGKDLELQKIWAGSRYKIQMLIIFLR